MSHVFHIELDLTDSEYSEPDEEAPLVLTPRVTPPKVMKNSSIRRFPKHDSTFEIKETDYIPTHVYNLIKRRQKKFLSNKMKYFFLNKESQIFSCHSTKKTHGHIQLNESHVMVIRNNGLEFHIIDMNTNLTRCSIKFEPPRYNEEFSRHIKMLVREQRSIRLVSCNKSTEGYFDNHFFLESKKNMCLSIANTNKIVFSLKKVQQNRYEIVDKMGIDPILVYGITLACAVGAYPVSLTSKEYLTDLLAAKCLPRITSPSMFLLQA